MSSPYRSGDFFVFDHPFRTLFTIVGLAVGGIAVAGVALGGYRLEDPELEMQLAWVRAFKQDAPPELSRQIARGCRQEIGRSPWTRDGAFALFSCIREEAEERGYFYEWDEEPAPAA